MHLLEKKEGLFHGDYGSSSLVEMKELGEDGEFEGYAAIFNNVDNGGDLIANGAFTQSLKSIPAERVRLLWQHHTDSVIGRVLELREDNKGLRMKGKLNLRIPQGAITYELLKDNAIDGLSIGYRSDPKSTIYGDGIRTLKRLDLFEVSVVTFGMNRKALITRVKSGETPSKRDIEEMLTRDAGLSSAQAKAFIAHGYKSLSNERDAEASDQSAIAALERMTSILRRPA